MRTGGRGHIKVLRHGIWYKLRRSEYPDGLCAYVVRLSVIVARS